LKLYAAHTAWLSAIPEDENKKSKGERTQTRAEGFKEGSISLRLPNVDEVYHIVQYWQELGCTASDGGPLPWSEIRAWRLENDLELTPFEVRSIREMSKAYVYEYHQAKDIARPSPYKIEVAPEDIDRNAVGSNIKNMLASFGKK